jgi:hypothetical protein
VLDIQRGALVTGFYALVSLYSAAGVGYYILLYFAMFCIIVLELFFTMFQFLSLFTIFTAVFDIYCLAQAAPGSTHYGYYIISFEFVYVGNVHGKVVFV